MKNLLLLRFSVFIMLIVIASSQEKVVAAYPGSFKTGDWSSASTWNSAALTGTATSATNSRTVTGSGTLFSSEFQAGDVLYLRNIYIGVVQSVTNNTSLTLQSNAASAQSARAVSRGRVPTSSESLTINTGHTVTVNTSDAVCASLAVGSGGGTSTLKFATTGSPKLSVTNAVVIGNSGNTNRIGVVTMEDGSTLECGSLNLGAIAANTNSLSMANGGLLKISGTVTVFSGFTWTPGTATGTVEMAAASTLPATIFITFNNLTLSAGTTTLGATTTTVNKTLSMEGGSLNLNEKTLTYGSSATLQYKGSSAQTTADSEFPASFTTGQLSSIKIENASGVTLNAAKNIGSRSLIIGSAVSGSTFKDGGFTLTSAGSLNLNSGFYVVTSSAFPAFTAGITIASGTTVEYAAAETQTIKGITYSNLTISGTGKNSKKADAAITVNGILNLSSSNFSDTQGCLDMNTTPFTLNMGVDATTTGTGDVTGIVKREHTFSGNVPYSFGNQYTTLTFVNASGTSKPGWVSCKISIGSAPTWRSTAVKRVYTFARDAGNDLVVMNLHYLDTELQSPETDENKLVLWDAHGGPTFSTSHTHGKSNNNTTNNWVGFSGLSVDYIAPSTSLDNKQWGLAYSTATKIEWLGADETYPTKWDVAANWIGGVPLTTSDVLIPTVSTNKYPVLTANIEMKTLEIASGATLTAAGYNVTINGTTGAWINNGTFNPGETLPTAGSVKFSHGNQTPPSYIVTLEGSNNNFFNLEITDNTYLQPTSGSQIKIAGNISAGTGSVLDFVANSNTIEFNGTGNRTIINPTGPGSDKGYHDLKISNTTGTITFPSALDIAGDFTNNGTVDATTNSGTVYFDGSMHSHDQHIYGSTTFNNLTIDNNHDYKVFAHNSLTVNGTLSIAPTSVLDMMTNALAGSFTTENTGTLKTQNLSSIFPIDKTWSMSVELNGSAIQSLPAGTFSNQLIIANAAGIHMEGDVIVNGTLTLTDGVISTSSYKLTMGSSGTISGASSSKYIDGKLAHTYAATGSKTFPIGKGGYYRPLTLQYTTLSGTSEVTAEQTESTITGDPPSNFNPYSGRHWTITQTGGSDFIYNITLDGTGLGINQNKAVFMIKGDGTTNAAYVPTGTYPNYTYTGFNSFSNFALGYAEGLTWTGSTSSDWSTPGNWNPAAVPLPDDNATIPSTSQNPIINNALSAPATVYNLTINSGAGVDINAGKALTVYGTLANNAGANGLVIYSDASGTGSLINSTADVDATVKRYLAKYNNISDYMFHFISSPVAEQAIRTEFVENTPLTGVDFYSWDEVNYQWINSKLENGSWNTGFESNFVPGKGYMAAYPADVYKTFTGKLNTYNSGSPLAINCTYTAGKGEGWNLLGNPFPSAIDWDLVKDNLGGGMDKALYYRDNALQNYRYYINIDNVSIGSGQRYIPAMQGFMVHANTNNSTFSFYDDFRVHEGQNIFYKAAGTLSGGITLTVTANGKYDETFIHFTDGATEGFDGWADAYKLSGEGAGIPHLYTVDKEGNNLAINGLPDAFENLTIPLSLKPGTSGSQTLSANLGNFDHNIYLIDKKTGTEQPLHLNPQYAFGAEVTDNPDRFELKFRSTGIGQGKNPAPFQIYSFDRNLFIRSAGPLKSTVMVYNITGQVILSESMMIDGLLSIPVDAAPGWYLVKVISGNYIATNKVLIR